MIRPGPLRDLPLDLFLPPPIDNNLKRPGSPSSDTPNPKRRLLSIDALPGSPMSVVKATPKYRHSVDFGALLSGPDSPVRKLDFSSKPKLSTPPNDHDMDITPRPRTRAAVRASLFEPPLDLNTRLDESSSSSSGTSRVATESRVSDTVQWTPPVTDPKSEHFPGFYVYPDARPLEARPHEPQSLEEQSWCEDEPEKENTQPPRQIHGLTSLIHSPAKSTSSLTLSVVKGKPTIPSSSYLSVARRKIFGTVEDALDPGEPYDYARRAVLSSNVPDEEKDSPSS